MGGRKSSTSVSICRESESKKTTNFGRTENPDSRDPGKRFSSQHLDPRLHKLLYIISCSHCSKLYAGETHRKLNERFTEHLHSVPLAYNTPVANHLNNPPHKISHISIAAVWQNASTATCRKYTDSQIISKLGIFPPFGINIRQ